MLSLVITRIQQLTPRIRHYELRNTDGQDLPLIAAGAHLTIPITDASGRGVVRQYSICSDPTRRDIYEIAVLAEQKNNSYGQQLQDIFTLGMTFICEPPSNHFPLHADTSPSLLLAGGIGIAALKPMAQTLARRGRRFQLHYAGRSRREMAFSDTLGDEFGKQFFCYPADEELRMDVMQLLSGAPHNIMVYVCGPRSLIDATYSAASALGISSDRIHSESFAPQKSTQDKPLILELLRSNKLLQVAADQPLLAAIQAAGVAADFDCCVGECGTCAVKIIEGEADHRDSVLSDAARKAGMICICVSRARSEKLVLDL